MAEAILGSTPVESAGRRTLRRVLKSIAIIGFVVILVPGYSFHQVGNTTTTSYWLGLPFSPWLRYTKEETKTEDATHNSTTMGFTTHMEVQFLSYSVLIGAMAYAANFAAKKLRPLPSAR